MATKKTPAKKVVAKIAAKKPNKVTKPAKETKVKPQPKTSVKVRAKTPKEIATRKGEPYVAVISVELDPNNVGNGAFEIDFNDIFLAKLIKAGYSGKDDYEIVDRWFTEVCRNIVAEEFEQWEANQPLEDRPRVVNRKNLGSGKTEIS